MNDGSSASTGPRGDHHAGRGGERRRRRRRRGRGGNRTGTEVSNDPPITSASLSGIGTKVAAVTDTMSLLVTDAAPADDDDDDDDDNDDDDDDNLEDGLFSANPWPSTYIASYQGWKKAHERPSDPVSASTLLARVNEPASMYTDTVPIVGDLASGELTAEVTERSPHATYSIYNLKKTTRSYVESHFASARPTWRSHVREAQQYQFLPMGEGIRGMEQNPDYEAILQRNAAQCASDTDSLPAVLSKKEEAQLQWNNADWPEGAQGPPLDISTAYYMDIALEGVQEALNKTEADQPRHSSSLTHILRSIPGRAESASTDAYRAPSIARAGKLRARYRDIRDAESMLRDFGLI
ncbi:uncharacterized protein I303_103396 [Kwoniella dejecticola CBS 10117]|uniref:Uncharacterized protein n=1 Tax=Kwoniella dejecticola CBS 10117 TaxID=1296121 RepID=A0A1A6A6N0_9TREE|nr:uncharacterized protein I303_03419 [Kwoniella dejecticola CBS 10117]OBR85708.1 hypothetical protein I303_03419 [Kwoniella dejecticola CBS 10117]